MDKGRSNTKLFAGKAIFLTLFAFGIVVSMLLWNVGATQSDNTSAKTKYPARIVSLTPSVTECIFALGCEDKLVGVSQFCNYPPEASKLPRMGGRINPNFEKLLSLRPDIVIYQGNHSKVESFCKTYNIDTMKVELRNFESIFSDIKMIGQKLGADQQAVKVVARIEKAIEDVQQKLAGTERPSVFFCLGRLSGSMTSLTTIGGGTFISELVDFAGGENIFADLTRDYVEINKEPLRQLDPDVIIEIRPGENLSDEDIASLEKDWGDMPGLSAVKNGNVYVLTDVFLLMPTPRLTLAIDELARVIHPEAFENE
jgi:iron complex transport system substrate-binding protein